MSYPGRYNGRVACPAGCGSYVYRGNLDRHLIACQRTDEERRAIAWLRRLKRGRA